MHTVHSGLSIAASLPYCGAKVSKAETVMEGWKSKLCSKDLPIFSCSKSTLFVSGVIIPEQYYHGKKLPPAIMLLTSFSGPLKYHINELVIEYASELRELFQHSIDFPDQALNSCKALKKFLLKHKRLDTFYTGMQCITCADIEREDNLRKEIEKYIEMNYNNFSPLHPLVIQKRIQNYINAMPGFSWARNSCKKTFYDWLVLYNELYFLGLLIVAFVGLPFWIFRESYFLLKYIGLILIFVPMLTLVFLFRFKETRQQSIATRSRDDVIKKVAATQSNPVINEMTAAGPLKNGWVRRVVYFIVLRLISLGRGMLTIKTIATARWLTIDKGKRLVFISNFTNLSESYVRDFIDSSDTAHGINLLFGNGEGYPPTRWGWYKGAIENPDGFMNVVQKNQHVTQFWYWPYKNLSIDNINNNRKIREGLFSAMSKKDTLKWLSRI